MVEAIKTDIRGLKCDTPGCGYRDETIPFSDYEKWIDVPCPKCGGNLLTRGDYDMTMWLTSGIAAFNQIIGDVQPAPPDAPRVRIAVEMNGTGEVAFWLKPDAEKMSPTPLDTKGKRE